MHEAGGVSFFKFLQARKSCSFNAGRVAATEADHQRDVKADNEERHSALFPSPTSIANNYHTYTQHTTHNRRSAMAMRAWRARSPPQKGRHLHLFQNNAFCVRGTSKGRRPESGSEGTLLVLLVGPSVVTTVSAQGTGGLETTWLSLSYIRQLASVSQLLLRSLPSRISVESSSLATDGDGGNASTTAKCPNAQVPRCSDAQIHTYPLWVFESMKIWIKR